jgi:glyoxylase-like metal-dependent hydrolase (beta-lactamase superfamily II)
MELAEGIYRIDGVRASNAYLVVAEDGLMVVDTGMRGAKAIATFIRDLGQQLSEVRHIVITHPDIDHVGGVAELKQLTGASVAIHELDAPVLAGRQPSQKGGAIMTLLRRLFATRPVEPDVLLKDGDVIAGFRVVHVPGHTPGSIALRRDDGVMFAGDALLSDNEGYVRPPRPSLAWDSEQATRSAEKLESLGYTLLLTGHGAPVRKP